jgi:hypothetical protein
MPPVVGRAFLVITRTGVVSRTQAVRVLFPSLHASSRVRGPLQWRNFQRPNPSTKPPGVNYDGSMESSSNSGPALRYGTRQYAVR